MPRKAEIKQTKPDSDKTDALDGVSVDDLNPAARQELKIPDAVQGALVTAVNPDSNAADAGLQLNDVMVAINRQSVTNSAAAIRLCIAAKTDHILVKIWRRAEDSAATRFLNVDNTKRDTKGK